MSSGYSYTVGHGYVVREETAGVWLVRDRTGAPVARAKTWRKAIWWAFDAPPVEAREEAHDDDGHRAPGARAHPAGAAAGGSGGAGGPGVSDEGDDLGHVPDGDAREAAAWLAGLGAVGNAGSNGTRSAGGTD